MSSTDGGRATPLERVDELLGSYGAPKVLPAELLCDRHERDAVAYTVVGDDLASNVLTYGELRESSERFAAGLAHLGVGPGDRVATLLGKSSELLIALVAIWRVGAVHVPLFTAFAPPAIATRLDSSAATIVICDQTQRPKLQGTQARRIITTGARHQDDDLRFADLLAEHATGFPAATCRPDDPLVHIFTSGTTGTPKGIAVPVKALASFHAYMEFALDLHSDDVFWNAADPGWGYGLYFGVIGSLLTGVSSVLLEGGFSAERTFAVLTRLRVTNFAAAPTVYRALRAEKPTPPRDLVLRAASSAGEPLTPEVNEWAGEALGLAVHDHYGQSETGMVVNNHHHPALRQPLKTGSMGQAMPGWRVVVLDDERDEVAPPRTMGRIAIDLEHSPLAWFSGYVGEPAKTAEKFSADNRWYLTGDTGLIDEDGYFHFAARDDDVIIMAGYRIGPFDVESALLSHPAVAEAAVIAAPDQMRGEVLEAYVVLTDQDTASPELERELQRLVKDQFAAHAYPRAVHFITELPKTPSGKIQRYVLRRRRAAEEQGSHS